MGNPEKAEMSPTASARRMRVGTLFVLCALFLVAMGEDEVQPLEQVRSPEVASASWMGDAQTMDSVHEVLLGMAETGDKDLVKVGQSLMQVARGDRAGLGDKQ